MVVPEATGGADPLAGRAAQQVHDGLHGHRDRGIRQELWFPSSCSFLSTSQDRLAEICIQGEGDDRRLEEAENNDRLVNECGVVIL